MKKYMTCVLVFSMVNAVQRSWTAQNKKQMHPEGFQTGEQALLVPLLTQKSFDSRITIHRQFTPIDPEVTQRDNEHDAYLQAVFQKTSTTIPIFPDVITKIVISYLEQDKERERLYKAIQKALKSYKATQWMAAIALSGNMIELALGSTAIATNQLHLVPRANSNGDLFFASVGVVVSSVPVLAPWGMGAFLDCCVDEEDSWKDEIIKKKFGRAIIYSACSTVAFGLCTVSVAALVGANSPMGSAGVLLVGGLLGSMNATRLLVKSCLRSHRLTRRLRELEKE
jgi:hypothetical protein